MSDESMVDLGGGMVVPLREVMDDPAPPESCEECDGQGYLDGMGEDEDDLCPACGGFGR